MNISVSVNLSGTGNTIQAPVDSGTNLYIPFFDGNRQFKTAYIEIPKKNGKSELAAAVALYLLFGDGEASPEVYGAAADRQQASIVFDVAKVMTELNPALMKRCKLLGASKKILNNQNNGFYQVLSAEVADCFFRPDAA